MKRPKKQRTKSSELPFRSIITTLCLLAAISQNEMFAARIPRLVVTITIDELRGDLLDLMDEGFTEGGFKQLRRQGASVRHLDFGLPTLDRSNAAAGIHTGTYPFYHGIIGDTYFDSETYLTKSIIFDRDYISNFSALNVSPRSLKVSNLADELKLAYEGFSRVYTIAPSVEEAVISAGHAADGAFWIDDRTGNWATTTYFKPPPTLLETYNRTASPALYLDTAVWRPLFPVDHYRFIPSQRRDFAFAYSFPRTDDRVARFETSGLVNNAVVRFARHLLEDQELGKQRFPDLLNLSLSASNYLNRDPQDLAVEMQDIYLRLDRDLAQLIALIDKQVGLDNALIVVASNNNSTSDEYVPERLNIPTGEFYTNRCAALLNFYLMSVYGKENWVRGYHNEQIFLERQLIEKRGLTYTDVLSRSSEFLLSLTGVRDVVTIPFLLYNANTVAHLSMRNGIYTQLSGDLWVEIQPGWTARDERNLDSKKIIRKTYFSAPLFLIGGPVLAGKTIHQISAPVLTATLAHAMRIRPPNACVAQPDYRLLK